MISNDFVVGINIISLFCLISNSRLFTSCTACIKRQVKLVYVQLKRVCDYNQLHGDNTPVTRVVIALVCDILVHPTDRA